MIIPEITTIIRPGIPLKILLEIYQQTLMFYRNLSSDSSIDFYKVYVIFNNKTNYFCTNTFKNYSIDSIYSYTSQGSP